MGRKSPQILMGNKPCPKLMNEFRANVIKANIVQDFGQENLYPILLELEKMGKIKLEYRD